MLKTHSHYKHKLDRLHAQQNQENLKLFDAEAIKTSDETHPLDTVGAIVMDRSGHLASAVSSGGILLKHPGRVGHASIFGCGCWVEEDIQFVEDNHACENHSIAICTTGCGEYILKTLFAKECSNYICRHRNELGYNLNEFFKKKFFSVFISFTDLKLEFYH
jgi:taspase (threonine aspartase 1)